MVCSKSIIINKFNKIFYLKYTCDKIKIKYTNQKKEIILKRKNDCYECVSHKIDKYGYAVIHMNKKFYKMHRFIYCLLTNKEFKDIEKLVLQHYCDNRLCCNPLHLIPGTHNDNMYDMRSKNRSCWGERNRGSKVTDIDTLYIYNSDMPLDYLADMYGLTVKRIRQIKSGNFNKEILNKENVYGQR